MDVAIAGVGRDVEVDRAPGQGRGEDRAGGKCKEGASNGAKAAEYILSGHHGVPPVTPFTFS